MTWPTNAEGVILVALMGVWVLLGLPYAWAPVLGGVGLLAIVVVSSCWRVVAYARKSRAR